MANYQTLTEINDLLEKIEILKTEKENLRSFLKNLKPQSSQNLYQYKIEKQKQNRTKVKSVFLKQNLLIFKQKESELTDKMKIEYSLEIEKNFEFLIRNICGKIALEFFGNSFEEKARKNSESQVICSEYWQEMIQNYGFDNVKIDGENAKKTFSEKKANSVLNSNLVLRIILSNRIYFLDKNFFIASLSEYLVAQNLTKIAKIKIKTESNLNSNSSNQNETFDQYGNKIDSLEIQELDRNNNNNLPNKKKTQELELEEVNLLQTNSENI